MAFDSGTRRLLWSAASWGGIALIAVAAISHLGQLRSGAEKLLGRGDMLYMAPDAAKPKRLQGVFVSDEEIERLVEFWTQDRFSDIERPTFDHLFDEAKAELEQEGATDDMFERAKELAYEHNRISTSLGYRATGLTVQNATTAQLDFKA